MKTLRAGLVGGLAALVLGGCSLPPPEATYVGSTNIIGGMNCVPLSVAYTPPGLVSNGSLTVFIDCDGRRFLASGSSSQHKKITEAAVLIQAEIDDGDKEPINLEGNIREGNKFDIIYLTVNGYKFQLG